VGTPAAPTVFAEEIDPAECATPPRPVAEVEALVATPLAGPREGEPGYTPEPTIGSEADLPQGPPAHDETVAAIEEVERQFAACYNTGNVGAVLALLGDEAARELLGDLLGDGAGTQAVADVLATPTAPRPAEERISLFPLRGVRELPDGRIGAIVEWGTSDDPPGIVSEANFNIYEQVDGRWVIVEGIGSFEPDRQKGE
jgi:hypothetical protein